MGLKQQTGQEIWSGVRFAHHTLMTDSWEWNILSLSLSFIMWSVFFCPSLCVSLSYRNAAAQAVGGNNLIKYERTSNELRKERGSEKKRRGEVTEGWCVCVQKVMQLINLNTLLQRVVRTLSKFDVIVSHCVSCLDRQRRRDSNDRHSTGQIATWDRIDLPNQQQKPADSVRCWLWQEHPGVCDVKLRKEIWKVPCICTQTDTE